MAIPREEDLVVHTFAADGQSKAIVWPGGDGVLIGIGTDFGSGSLSVQTSLDDGATWGNVGTALTDDGSVVVTLPANKLVRLSLSGSTSPTLTGEFTCVHRNRA